MAETRHPTPASSASSAPAEPRETQIPSGGFAAILAVMRIAAYRDFTVGSTLSVIGVWLQRVATGWLTWELTETPSWLGIILFTDLFTMILCSPLWGVVADRMDRVRLMQIAQSLLFCHAVTITLCYLLGWITIEWLVVLTAFMGVGHAAHSAGRLSLLPNLVPKSLIAQAIAINAMSFNTARFVGPAIAGVVIASWGLTPAFAINAMTYVAFALLLRRVKMMTPDKARTSKAGMWREMAEGFRYAARHAGIGPMLLMMLATAFTIRALPDLLPAFAAQVFGRGIDGLAWLTSAMGLGAMLGGLQVARQHGTQGLTLRVIWNVALMGVALAALAATEDFRLGVIAALACGYVLTMNGTGTQTLVQAAVEGALRGRVMAVYTLIYQGAPAIGAVVLGALADHFGMRWPFMGGAAVCLVVWLWMLRRAGSIRATLETSTPIHPRPAAAAVGVKANDAATRSS